MDAGASFSSNSLHVAMIPWLAVGHITPYFELAKIFAEKGHLVTFISTPKNIDRMPKTPKHLEPFITFVSLPLPHVENLPEGGESTMDVPTNKSYYLKLAYEGLKDDIANLLKTSKPDWVFYDFATEWLPPIAKALNIPCAHYNITPAWNKVFYDPPKDQLKSNFTIEDMCGPPTWLPFHTNVRLRPHEIMRAVSAITDENTGKRATFDLSKAYSSGDMFLLRTCRELEGEWLDYLANRYNIPIVPVGLVPPSIHIRDVEDEDNSQDWVTIKAWLDTLEPSSVVYVAFGSELILSQQDLTELAHGIELSGLPFFWALRILKAGILELPEGFEERTKDRGIVWKTWAPQTKILGHEAIGGCICHCGINSLVEMLNFGHVLVTLPYLLDQALFARVLEEKKVAIEVTRSEQDGSFTRDSVAKALRFAMVDEEGSTLRKNANEMGKIFSSADLHNQYIDDCIAALQKHKITSST
ncbi:soyasaponin III rhamnosyltransferase-like [Abrus precatorius]|uniref:Soyasaponin III rhamnosyltransferase-like n=1 Tax=Abrus precatorius TaxID=3816 RepID=A0A8B8K7W2_ABRPR|nr:soyasaponin III rhamnosyltransferase-like [Abrus precatorius]